MPLLVLVTLGENIKRNIIFGLALDLAKLECHHYAFIYIFSLTISFSVFLSEMARLIMFQVHFYCEVGPEVHIKSIVVT